MVLGNIVLNSGAWLVLKAGTYNINSMKLNSGAILKISTGPVIFNVAGVAQTTPIDFTGGAVSNTTFDPSNSGFYAGTDERTSPATPLPSPSSMHRRRLPG